ncbi:MAG: aldehyde ferredoxin oxidoreductase C-terminal domain-containing protein, partial [Chloroflexota bacterium]|nr:aldehyde ferredoxin oxidoreductase C-terminal domain-containing protein [Chloroflexota bacterium]
KDTYQTSDLLRKETEERASVACIGMAGERGALVAGIVNDGWDGRFAARGGLGAVMGSKNLKAIVLRGTRKPQVADAAALKESTQPVIRYLTEIKRNMGPKRLRMLGGIMRDLQDTGNLPVRNWSRGRFESFVKMVETSLVHTKLYFCYSCPVGCAESTIGPKGREIVGEAIMPMGSNCLIDDLEALEEAYRLCNRYGMDSISVGACVAFGMEAFEKGLITREDTDGVELTWGNAQALVDMVKQMGEAKSFGKLLGQGVKRAAAQIGGDAAQFAMHVKGLEAPLHDPRAYPSLLLSYATANRGCCHLESHSYAIDRKKMNLGNVAVRANAQELGWPPEKVVRLSFEGKADIAAKTQDLEAMNNSLCICNFSYFTYGVQAHNYV